MPFDVWLTFATFWVIFVISPGPNAVNCISTAISVGFTRSLWTVAAILTQAFVFLWAAALGVSALILAAPTAFFAVQLGGALVLIFLGLRAFWLAGQTPRATFGAGKIYGRALAIATLNAKSLAGYVAAFSQFITPNVPLLAQMQLILPTALTLTAASYTGYCALGAWMGRAALSAVFHVWVRRALALCFIFYGFALGALALFP